MLFILIQANKAGADEALMLDPHGFVATCNSVNFFMVRDGGVWAPRGAYQMRGITRTNLMRICEEEGIPIRECDFYLTQVSVTTLIEGFCQQSACCIRMIDKYACVADSGRLVLVMKQ